VIILPKLPWLHRDLLCSTVHCWEPGAQGPHCDAPIARATHAETPFALQAQGLGEVASNPTERNIPLRIKKGTLGPSKPPDFIEEMARGIEKLRFIAAFIVFNG